MCPLEAIEPTEGAGASSHKWPPTFERLSVDLVEQACCLESDLQAGFMGQEDNPSLEQDSKGLWVGGAGRCRAALWGPRGAATLGPALPV